MIDLHTHSTASDGKLSPSALMAHAAEAGIEVIALTDHDTLSGLAEARQAAGKLGIEFIPGIEISAEYNPGTMHMLGYFVDPGDESLMETLAWLRGGRDDRNRIILKKLAELGCPMDWDEVAALAGGESMGRPHIANAMLARGYVSTFTEAFDRYLGKGAAAYTDREKMTPERAVEKVLQAGGVPVLAHPQTLSLPDGDLSDLLGRLASLGLAGVEAHYYSHSAEETALYVALAEKHGLLATGGSDFHGPGMMETRLGVGRGNLEIPRSVADALIALHREKAGR
ncbi:MAG: PHP domain-containing protein [bacterium]|nr:PHP domain-containing protein [bacterium]MDT8395044.1 PHP domain-containing protein [bacterium]